MIKTLDKMKTMITFPSVSAIQREIAIAKKRFNDKNQNIEVVEYDLTKLYEQLVEAKKLKEQGLFN